MIETFWLALALMLVCEGILPFTQPALWRRMLLRVASMSDRQIRVVGLVLLMSGLILALWLR